jgi:hypothetical protein
LLPYDRPFLHGFTTPAFLDSAEAYRRALIDDIRRTFGDRLRVDEMWARVSGDRRTPNKYWLPKLYVCVGSRSYWAVVKELADSTDIVSLCNGFKIFNASTVNQDFRRSYGRPDKIVFYAPHQALAQLSERLRLVMEGRQLHTLRHTGRPDAYGLPRVAGLFVGLDPLFLGRLSWRTYRALCNYWLSVNRGYVIEQFGSIDHWLMRMNLDRNKEGPLSLSPPAHYCSFIQKQWSEMFEDDATP